MSVYNTTRCRINWTRIDSGGAATNVIPFNRDITLLIGAFVDPGLRNEFGGFEIHFTIVNSQGQPIDHAWTGFTPVEFPVFGNIWLAISFGKSSNATRQSTGLFLYRPYLIFLVNPPGGAWWPGGGGQSQFAVAPEDHYFQIE